MDLNVFKLLTSIMLWICALACGLLPLYWRNFNTNKLAISLSQCFAGGLFISIGLIHILPEARENLEDSWKHKHADGHEEEVFPLSYFICLLTFSAILLIDKVLFNNSDIIEGGEGHTDLRTSLIRKSFLGNRDSDPAENFQEMVSHNMKIALSISKANEENQQSDDDEYQELPNDHSPVNRIQNNVIEVNKLAVPIQSGDVNVEGNKLTIKHDHDHHDHKHEQRRSHNHGHGDDLHGHHHATVKKGASYTSALVILTAMGIHGLFEGLAYGVSTGETEIWNMFLAIAAHKWCDSLVVGISFVAAEIPLKMAVSLTIFLSLFTPMGIFIGYCASASQLITGIFQALSAGTFLYISCAEIIIEEFAIADKKFWKFLMYSFGIIFISVMAYIGHGHHHDD